MITNIIFVLGIVLLAVLFANIVESLRKKSKMALADKMSFRETLDLVDLPIVTFKNNNNKINFLLDTGASNSVINKSAIDKLVYNQVDRVENIYGADGNKSLEGFISMSILYKGKTFEEEFQTADLDKAFDNLKKDSGVNLSGILGNSFFQKYKYIIDFDEMVAYPIE